MSESAKERLLGLTRISLAYERAALLALEAAAEKASERTAQLPHDSDMTRGFTEGRLSVLAEIRALAEEVKRGG
jgi:hypothetical protein